MQRSVMSEGTLNGEHAEGARGHRRHRRREPSGVGHKAGTESPISEYGVVVSPKPASSAVLPAPKQPTAKRQVTIQRAGVDVALLSARTREAVNAVLGEHPEACAATMQFLASEGFNSVEEWRMMPDKIEAQALLELRRSCGLTIAQAAQLQREFAAAVSSPEPASPKGGAASRKSTPRTLLGIVWNLHLVSARKSFGLDYLMSTAFSPGFYRAAVLTNREADLKETFVGFCDAMITRGRTGSHGAEAGSALSCLPMPSVSLLRSYFRSRACLNHCSWLSAPVVRKSSPWTANEMSLAGW